MGLFSNLFPKKEKQQAVPDGKPFFTNAPPHWGTITNEFLEVSDTFTAQYNDAEEEHTQQRRLFMVNSLQLMGKLNRILTKITGDRVYSGYADGLLEYDEGYATSCCIEKLFSKGILSISGIVIDDHFRYGVMLFDTPVPRSYLDEIRAYFIEDGYKDLIHYCVIDPDLVKEDKALKFDHFNKSCFRYDHDKQQVYKRKYDEYAIWWVGELEQDFDSAPVKDDIEVCHDLLDFYNSYALGILSYAFGLRPDNSRVRLPVYDEVLIEGPEGVEIIISLSETKGINFHFPVEPMYENYRNKFMKVYINFCYDIRAQIELGNYPKDDFGLPSTLEWYRGVLAESVTLDADIVVIGLLTVGLSMR